MNMMLGNWRWLFLDIGAPVRETVSDKATIEKSVRKSCGRLVFILINCENACGKESRLLREENLALHHEMDEVTQAIFLFC